MQMKTLAVLATVLSPIVITSVHASPFIDVYAGATIGMGGTCTIVDDHTHNASAQSFGAVFGGDIPGLRFEAEYNHLRDNDMSLDMAFFNAYAKVPSTIIRPYFGLGLGASFDGDLDSNSDAKFDSTIAYQAMTGLTFDITILSLRIDIEGRALYIPDVYKFASGGHEYKPDAFHYEARLKLRYLF